MRFNEWWRVWPGRPQTRRGTQPPARRRRGTQLTVEGLEQRALLSHGPVRIAPFDPFKGITADDVPGQFGHNYPNTQVEPYVVVNPTRANNIVAIWQQDRWSNGSSRGNVVGVSLDAGNSWRAVPLPGTSLVSGGQLERASDPWLSFAPNGDLYAITLATEFGENKDESAMLVSKSIDGGLTWGEPAVLIDTDDPILFNDKETLTADPTDPNYVYAVWHQRNEPVYLGTFTGPTYFARSTDGGRSWEPARVILDQGPLAQSFGNTIVVQPDGTLVNVFGVDRINPETLVAEFTVQAMRSTDHGLTWEEPVLISAIDYEYFVSDPESGLLIRNAKIIPSAAVDPRSGQLYAVWQDGRFDPGDGVGVAFSTSGDGGRTWSDPTEVSQTPALLTGAQSFLPQIAVARDGTVAVTYYDYRFNTPEPGLPTDVWAVLARPGDPKNLPGGLANPANWRREVRLTPTSFDMTLAPYANGYMVGDYTGLAASGNRFIAVYSEAGTDGPDTAAVFSCWFGPYGSVKPLRAGAAASGHAAGVDTTAVHGTSIRRASPTGQDAVHAWGPARAGALSFGHNLAGWWGPNAAAGWSWSIDPMPWQDSPFTTPGEQAHPALPTVLVPEVSHPAGLDHDDGGAQSDSLPIGARRVPEPTLLDQVFAPPDGALFAGDGVFGLSRK